MNNCKSKDVLLATMIGLSAIALPLSATASTQETAIIEEIGAIQTLTPSYYWTYNPNIELGDYNSPLTELKDIHGNVLTSVPSHFLKRTPHMPHQQAFLFQPDQRIVKAIQASPMDRTIIGYEVINTALAPYGTDDFHQALIPWKSIKLANFPIGSQVYLEQYDGIQLPNGDRHNGKFVVIDTAPTGELEIFTGDADQYALMQGSLDTLKKVELMLPNSIVAHNINIQEVPGGVLGNGVGAKFAQGATASFVARPWKNYTLDKVTMDGQIIQLQNNQLFLDNISRSHDLVATFKPVLSTSYSITQEWQDGFIGTVTINNNTNEKITGWSLSWNFYGDQEIQSLWNATYQQNGNSVAVSSIEWNEGIEAGGSISFSFQANYSGDNLPAYIQVN
ncbi:MAG: hypothetical protein GY951_17100 [Psychromonas sp.]|nr:hypothetical protein [Alteromonadales bacterium]MCP5079757.1 hypothetical protein [Psychromonas sp.]